MICIGDIVCGEMVGPTALTSIQIGNGIGMVDIVVIIIIGVLGISILGTVIGDQVNGIGISGIIRGAIHILMDQELSG